MCNIVYSSLVFLGQVLDTENKNALICVTKSSLIIIVFPMKIFLLQYYYYYLYHRQSSRYFRYNYYRRYFV